MLIDFSVGAGMMIKSALKQGIKVLGICHNEAHITAVKRIVREYIVESVKSGENGFAPPDKDMKLAALKPARLVAYEKQDDVAIWGCCPSLQPKRPQ